MHDVDRAIRLDPVAQPLTVFDSNTAYKNDDMFSQPTLIVQYVAAEAGILLEYLFERFRHRTRGHVHLRAI